MAACRTAWPVPPRRTSCSTPTTPSTGGSGGRTRSPRPASANVPVLLSVGYAACHWCHVMAHESFEDDATAAYMNEHFVSIKVDREERPDVDADLHAGDPGDDRPGRLADDLRARPRRCAVLRRHLLPRPAAARAAGVPPGAGGAQRRPGPSGPTRCGGRRPTSASTCSGAFAAGRHRPGRRRRARRGGRGAAARVRRHAAAGSARRPKFPPSMTLEFLRRHAARDRLGRGGGEMVDRTLEAMARGGIYDQLARRVRALLASTPAGWCRTSRRCSTTTPSCSASTPAGARRSATGSPARPPTSCWRARHRGGRLRLRAGRRQPRRVAGTAARAPSTPGRPASWSRRSATTTAPGRRSCCR